MKNKYLILILLLGLSGIFTMQSCTKQKEPTPVVYKTSTGPVAKSPVVRSDGTVFFTGTTVTLSWTSQNTATNSKGWNLYFGTTENPPLYKTGLTQMTLAVPVSDGQTYYWKVDITDDNGVKTTSQVFSFTAVNGSNPDMTINLNVTTDVLSKVGIDLTADQVVDLRFLILNKSDMSIATIVDDGYANEEFDGMGSLPDGQYVLGVDIYSTKNFGDLNVPIDLSLSLVFNQLGITNQTLDFPNVMTNANPCSLYRTYLANVTKAGSTYAITKAVSYLTPAVLTWKGWDGDVSAGNNFPSQVTTTSSCTGKTMTGLGFGWMLEWWGETIISGGTLSYTVSGNTITIPLQKYCITTYNGAQQPQYSIQGSGTIDNSGAFPIYNLQYDFIQSGQSIGTISHQYGWPTTYFTAKITTNPAGLP